MHRSALSSFVPSLHTPPAVGRAPPYSPLSSSSSPTHSLLERSMHLAVAHTASKMRCSASSVLLADHRCPLTRLIHIVGRRSAGRAAICLSVRLHRALFSLSRLCIHSKPHRVHSSPCSQSSSKYCFQPVADDASAHHSRPQDSAAKQWTSTTKDNHTPLAQELDGSTSNNRVQALSVSKRILPSLPAAAQQKT